MKEIPYIFFGYGGYEEWESYYGHSGEDESTSEFENYPEDGFYIFCNNKQHFIDVYSKTCDVEVDAAKPLDRSYAIFAAFTIEDFEDYKDWMDSDIEDGLQEDYFYAFEEYDRVERKRFVTEPNLDIDKWIIQSPQNTEGMNPRSWPGVCEDVDKDTVEPGCGWVRLNKKERCPEYKDSCPQTCGKCSCQDNRFKRLIRVPGKELKQGCFWVRKDPNYRCKFGKAARKCEYTCNPDKCQ